MNPRAKMVTVLSGLVGGIVATIVMTVFMMALGDDSPPPTAAFYAKYLGDGSPEDYENAGLVMHMGYGLGAGAVFGWLGVAGLFAFTPVTLATGVINGLLYGLVLFVIAAVFWMNVVLDVEAEPAQVGLFLVFHLIYGLVLGAWVGLGVLG